MVHACNIMSHTQLSNSDLDSTIGVSTDRRQELLIKLTEELESNLCNKFESTIAINLTDDERLALSGIISHGSHWFNKTLLDFNREDTLDLLEYINSELTT